MLAEGAAVLLITDGLDRNAGEGLRAAEWSACTRAAGA
jgi:hypothetical protein